MNNQTMSPSRIKKIKSLHRLTHNAPSILSSGLIAASRIINILVFFIPIKILITINNLNINLNESEVLSLIQKNQTISISIGLIPTLYLLYIAVTFTAKQINKKNTQKITLAIGEKLNEFGFQVKTSEAYRRMTNINSELLIIISSLTIILIYSTYCAIFQLMLILSSLYLSTKYTFISHAKKTKAFDTKSISEHTTTISFILMFLAILINSIKSPENLIFSILALLLSRTLLLATKRMANELNAINSALKPIK